MSMANRVNERSRNGQKQRTATWPATVDGNIVEQEWQETTPAVYDEDEQSPTFGDELTPAVWGMVTVRDSPLDADELARWDRVEARDADRQEREAVKGLLADLTEIIDAESLTNAQAQTAIKKLARVARRLVKDAVQ